MTITNRGARAGSFTLRGVVRGSAELARRLRLTVRERRRGGKWVVDSGTLAGLHKVKLAGIAAGQARTFEFSVSLGAATPNRLQGLRVNADFVWHAVSAS